MIWRQCEVIAESSYTLTSHRSERDWLRDRLNGICGTEGAAVVGRSPYCSPYGLYIRKLEGRVENDGEEQSDMAEWGRRHEPAIAQKFFEVTQVQTQDLGEYAIARSKERPHVSVTLDRLCIGPMGIHDAVLEIKTAYYDAAKVWKERVPLYYQIQGQMQLYVTGLDVCHFACLLNGYQFRHLKMDRNERFITRLLERIDDFWFNHVKAGVAPEVDFSKATTRALSDQFPSANGSAVDLPDELESAGDDYDKACAEVTAAQNRKDALANRIRLAMGEHAVGLLPKGGGFTWKANGRGRTLRRNKNLKREKQ